MHQGGNSTQPSRQRPFAAALLAAVVLVLLWVTRSLDAATSGFTPSLVTSACVVAVFIGTFTSLSFELLGRGQTVAAGAAALLLLGSAFQFYFPMDAAKYVYGKADTLVLLAGLGVVTGVLIEAGAFERMALRMLRWCGRNRRVVMASLLLLTYALSAVVNNLATILVIIPLSLLVADALEMDQPALIFGEVIASNLGGASTMIGDFPNILIAIQTGMPFHKFLFNMAPICVVLLGILLLALMPAFPNKPGDPERMKALLVRLETSPYERSTALRGQTILALIIVGFALSGELNVSPAVVAAVGAAVAVTVGGVSVKKLFKHMCLNEVIFFSCLFMMVGAVEASGMLDSIGSNLTGLWRRNPIEGAIALAWGAALATSILNAGPTTALLIPLFLSGLGLGVHGEPVWWALSLGVLAGSSATLSGATAGPVAVSLLEKRGLELSFAQFARIGVPIALIFLVVSSGYLAIFII